MKSKLLIGCDKKIVGGAIRKHLETLKAEIRLVTPGLLRAKLAPESPDAVLMVAETSIKSLLPLIEAVRQFDDNLPIIALSPSKNVDDAVALMKMGVFDYLALPPDPARLLMTVQNALHLYKLTKRVFLLENRLGVEQKLDDMLGSAPSMQTVFQVVRNVAKTSATALILGESGTGKELVAKAIHRLSVRKDRRFIDINCGAIPQGLLENELFGHERGAYTGADRQYIGCCERADGGTLFLDEISEMDPMLQVKILRFLQERQFTRVGGTQSIQVDVRILAASNQNLAEAVAKNRFREDLYYRLNVVSILLPPLRERSEDIPLLARHFLEKYSHKNEKIFLDFTPEAMEALLRYGWPGNIRELENTIERAVVLHNDTKIKFQFLPPQIQRWQEGRSFPANADDSPGNDGKVLPLTLVERYAIEAALRVCTGNVAMAAKKLKIGQATLYRKIKQYGIRA